MKLEQTVELMTSDDYKDRFKAEYYQLSYRINKLQKTITDANKHVLPFELDCSVDILQCQLDSMRLYQKILKRRAEIEKIEL